MAYDFTNKPWPNIFSDFYTELEGYLDETGGEVLTSETPVNGVASQGTLTVAVQPLSGDTMTIGDKVFTFVAEGTANADGEIGVGADLAGAKTNIVAAINGSDGWNTASAYVTAAAFATNDCVLTALIRGVAGDLIATTQTFDNVGNVFDAATLGTTTAGVDGTVGSAGQLYYGSTYLYLAVATNTIADANWRRVSLGSAF